MVLPGPGTLLETGQVTSSFFASFLLCRVAKTELSPILPKLQILHSKKAFLATQSKAQEKSCRCCGGSCSQRARQENSVTPISHQSLHLSLPEHRKGTESSPKTSQAPTSLFATVCDSLLCLASIFTYPPLSKLPVRWGRAVFQSDKSEPSPQVSFPRNSHFN